MSSGTEQIFLPDSVANDLRLQFDMMTRPGNGAPTINTINLDNVEDFTKVCRVCATVTDLVMPIFTGEGLRINLADKIKRYLPIQVKATDVLPLVVCYQCTSTLLAAHELASCSMQADAALRTARDQQQERAQRRLQPQAADDPSEGIVGDNPNDYRRCEYCPLSVLGALYTGHLLGAHAELLFHCDECDEYVSRRRFLAHMTAHANQYDAEGRKSRGMFDPNAAIFPLPSIINYVATRAAADSITLPPAPISISSSETGRDDDFSDVDEPPALVPRVEPRVEPSPSNPSTAPSGSNTKRPPSIETDRQIEPSGSNTRPASESKVGPVKSDSAERKPKSVEPKVEDISRKSEPTERKCPLCPKTYTVKSSYFYHLKYTHGQSREHACASCGRRFCTRGALREHSRLHEPAPQIECEQCGKRFRSNAGAYIHKQTHKDEKDKKYICAECGRAFRWRAELKRHLARHAAGRPHSCACGRAFAVRADLLRHRRTHARAAQPCPHPACRATFAQPRYLRAHLARKHRQHQPPAPPQPPQPPRGEPTPTPRKTA